MLEEVRIQNLGIIEESVLALAPGFTAITGETGAGKTMILTALGLVMGGRADSQTVRHGASQARVEAHFGHVSGLADAVQELGGELEEDAVLLARQVSAEGRSRAFLAGNGVPAAQLAALTERLVAVHGQSDQHRLLQLAQQREALDHFGGEALLTLREQCAQAYRQWQSSRQTLETLTTQQRERAQEAARLKFGLEEIEQVAPAAEEDQALLEEESRLAHADTLRLAAEQAREVLSSEQDGVDVLTLLDQARRQLDSVAGHDPAVADLARRLQELTYLAHDLSADVASYATGLETDPARLHAVSQRRADLQQLKRKYGESIEQVLEWSQQAALRFLELSNDDERVATLQAQIEQERADVVTLATELSRLRKAAAGSLAEAVAAELRGLAMPHAELEIEVRQVDAADGLPLGERSVRVSASGIDEVEFLFSANRGAPGRPLHKGASGGELSRVMLAVELALAATNPVPTLIFDEVDAGVGGRAAVEIGRRLARLAQTCQVLVVTHLPQVAAFADHHVVVSKSDDGRVTSSGLETLTGEHRARELARMLAGQEDSASALAHAMELLSDAASGAVHASR